MSLAQQLYEKAYFPAFERIKGRNTAGLYRTALATQWKSPEELELGQLANLNRLLAHAKTHCKYYRDHIEIPAILDSLTSLSALPELNKHIIRANLDNLISDDQRNSVWRKATGGSTGDPMQFAYTQESFEWRVAMSLRGYSWAGAAPGSKQAYIWGMPPPSSSLFSDLKVRLHQRSERKRYFNCFDFTDEKMQACLRYLKKWQPDCLVGYTNPLVELARLALKNGGAGFSVGSILTAAEKLHPVQRDLLVEAFGGDVFETYGSREFMLIGSECNHHNGLHVSAENLIVEVVDENGHPVPAGSTGRLLITDLNNYGMPFIRYEVGDMARASDKVCECGRGLPLLDGIVGRSLDILRAPSGKVIPGEYFVYFMMDFEEISRYQVVQRQLDRLELRLQSKHPLSKQTLENIHQRISAGLDSTINLDIVTDAEISLTPTGKHRVTISELDATA